MTTCSTDAQASLLPGWATDVRIFGGVPSPTGTLLGWSLGGFRAVAAARARPEQVRRLILVSVRRQYPPAQIAAMRAALRADRAACLTAFYRQCFLPAQKDDFRRFRVEQMPGYLETLTLDCLDADLAELGGAVLSPDDPPPCPVVLVHGTHDIVSPIAEARELAAGWGCPLMEFDAAHAVCISADFRAWLEGLPAHQV